MSISLKIFISSMTVLMFAFYNRICSIREIERLKKDICELFNMIDDLVTNIYFASEEDEFEENRSGEGEE